MVTLYITSIERHCGKKLITMGLIERLRRDGFKVGYFKPMGHFPIKVDNIITDRGAWLIYRLFELEDPIELICPVVVTQDLIMQNYDRDVTGLQERIEDAFEKISREKDVVIVGCDNNFSEGSSLGVSGIQLIKLLNTSALFVERYACDFCIDFLLELKKVIGDPMIGVVFNQVNDLHVDEVKKLVLPFLDRKHMTLFGSLPQDTLLGSIGVSDLVDHLSADVVGGKDKLDGLVENFLVGGMQVDKFISYLLKKPGSGIIVGGDRTDIQLVAIENGVKCLILSGNLYPNNTIVTRAEAKGVPILVVKDDTYTVAKNVKAMVGQFSLQKREKIDHGIKLVGQAFDFEKLYERLNLVPR
ncbi:MAG: phosphotransacetylase family protein [Deltaproteobacteria bacterium]|nr:phosphotransacetylase family protein [Deltaproteobacteria bacterium]MBW2019062.1 phosphotransacetylase family protein [Deltaproteobacteria bacterium]MBW2073547.1 phosphotransacetylase family protein [Deltaproteobacteria bacterium]